MTASLYNIVGKEAFCTVGNSWPTDNFYKPQILWNENAKYWNYHTTSGIHNQIVIFMTFLPVPPVYRALAKSVPVTWRKKWHTSNDENGVGPQLKTLKDHWVNLVSFYGSTLSMQTCCQVYSACAFSTAFRRIITTKWWLIRIIYIN